MRHDRIAGEDPGGGISEEHTDSVVLDFMLCGPSWPWSVEEISRELGQRTNAEDAVSRLTETGLLHRFGEFVFPTRTARRARDMEIGTG
jgi:predicted transcriptional regulator